MPATTATKKPAAPDADAFADGLLRFLDRSPTPFHATANLAEWLGGHGFVRLDERDDWAPEPGGKYLVTRNDSSIIALRWGDGPLRLLGAHTDSPCLHIKPMPDMHRHGCRQLAVEPYGGVLLAPWFDRDLSLAGRVGYADGAGQLHSALLDFRRPLASIPSLAIHLDRSVNEKRSINKQRDLPLVLSLDAKAPSFATLLQRRLREEHGIKGEILSHEICAYDSQGAARLGLDGELLCSARLDNLLSCYICAWALIHSRGAPCLFVANDHEEVGSRSACGADGPFLNDCLGRLYGGRRAAALADALLISVDNTHAVHPNRPERHDDNHGPQMHGGPVIKVNSDQRYASNSPGMARFRKCCDDAGVGCQFFVSRSDLACGSTIGPITAAATGIQTLDVGVPQWAMHSVRETAAMRDCTDMARALQTFLS